MEKEIRNALIVGLGAGSLFGISVGALWQSAMLRKTRQDMKQAQARVTLHMTAVERVISLINEGDTGQAVDVWNEHVDFMMVIQKDV